jgi:hypothetical protein
VALLAGLALSGAANAAPVTIDFENYSGSQLEIPPVVSGGFNFTPATGNLAVLANGAACGPNCAANGTETLVMGAGSGTNPASTGPLTMVNASGTNFYLLAFDYAEFVQGGHVTNAVSITVTGNLFGGGTVSQTLNLDGINDGPGGVGDFETSSLASFWASSLLTSVDFTSTLASGGPNGGYQLDNINVSFAPEPGMLALLGLAAAGLGFAGRRKHH